MIAIDCQPFSIVEDVGFTRSLKALDSRYSFSSWKYFTETVLPQIHQGITAELKKDIAGISWFSFTTDIWSTEVSSEFLLSLITHYIAHWIFWKEVSNSHTGEYICSQYKDRLEHWGIKHEHVYLIIQDNAANIVNGMRHASYPDLSCFALTLQLIVPASVLSQWAFIDTLAACRQIVGHFKHSPLAYFCLKEIQQNLGLQQHCLKQDEPTHWNSCCRQLRSKKWHLVFMQQSITITRQTN